MRCHGHLIGWIDFLAINLQCECSMNLNCGTQHRNDGRHRKLLITLYCLGFLYFIGQRLLAILLLFEPPLLFVESADVVVVDDENFIGHLLEVVGFSVDKFLVSSDFVVFGDGTDGGTDVAFPMINLRMC